MKKSLLLLLLLAFPLFSFSQSLTGKWASTEDQARMVEFNADGTMNFIDTENPEDMEGVVIKYSQVVENGEKYLICEVFVENEKVDSQKNVYKIEGDKLTIIDNPDEVMEGKSPDNVFTRVKK